MSGAPVSGCGIAELLAVLDTELRDAKAPYESITLSGPAYAALAAKLGALTEELARQNQALGEAQELLLRTAQRHELESFQACAAIDARERRISALEFDYERAIERNQYYREQAEGLMRAVRHREQARDEARALLQARDSVLAALTAALAQERQQHADVKLADEEFNNYLTLCLKVADNKTLAQRERTVALLREMSNFIDQTTCIVEPSRLELARHIEHWRARFQALLAPNPSQASSSPPPPWAPPSRGAESLPEACLCDAFEGSR